MRSDFSLGKNRTGCRFYCNNVYGLLLFFQIFSNSGYPATKISTLPSVCSQISGPVVSSWAFGLAGFSNCPKIIEQAELSGGDIDAALKLSSTLFWILATLVGTVQGGIQALSRSYFGQLIPPERSNEYYGFLDIFGKFSCVIGPALYAATYAATGRASLGILSIIVLFFGGMVALFAGRKYMKAEEK